MISLAYMWQRDQSELLQEMIECGLQAILIKVAALGLYPSRHLGRTIQEMQPYLESMVCYLNELCLFIILADVSLER